MVVLNKIMSIGLLDKLYENHSILATALADKQIAQKSLEYEECMQGFRGNAREKKLTIQIITKFYKYFPRLQELALDYILDLCEDRDADIRQCAIKFLPTLGKDNREYIIIIAHSLSQLLQLDLPDYYKVCDSLGHIFKLDPVNALTGIFKNIYEMEEGPPRDKALEFTYTKLDKMLEPDEQRKADEMLLNEARCMIKDCSSKEFLTLMTYMLGTDWAKLEGREEVFQIIEDQIVINEVFSLDDIDRLAICVDFILPLFDHNGDPSRFVDYYCQEVLPKFEEIGSLKNGDQYQAKLIRQLTFMSPHCKEIEPEVLDDLLESLKQFIPVPPDNASEAPTLELCHIECLLYTFHNLSQIHPEFLLLNDQEKLNDLRTRLQYLTHVVTDLDEGLKMKNKQNLRKDLSKVDRIRMDLAPKVFENLLKISQDFFKEPPVYEASVELSFTVVKSSIKFQDMATASAAARRRSPITFPSDPSVQQEKPLGTKVRGVYIGEGRDRGTKRRPK